MRFKLYNVLNSTISARLFLALLFILNVATLFSQEQKKIGQKYTPLFDGVLKAKYEYATTTNLSRFNVRNARVGFLGSISDPISYRAQIELNAEGKLTVLDLFANVKLFENFNLILGQTSLPLYNSYTTSPQALMFANRPFIGKFMTAARDIGALVNYTIYTLPLPVMLEFGVFNAYSINDPVWTNALSYAARVQLGTMQGLRATAKIYDYPLSEQKDYLVWGVDARYATSRYRVEAEVMNRHNRFDASDRLSYYVQGGYSFPFTDAKIFHDITPVVRWDALEDHMSNNRYFSAKRFTVGLDFGLSKKPFGSVLRFDYEHFFGNPSIPEFIDITNKEIGSNKFTVELLLLF